MMRARVGCFAAVLSAILAAPALCPAQDNGTSISGGLSGSISDPLLPGSETGGFNGSFDAGTSSITNPAVHADINDPTHAQLAGSALSPLDNAGVSAAPQTSPQTGTLSDAQAAVSLGAFGFGGHRNASFAPAAAAHTLPSAASQTSTAAFGGLAARSAFAGGTETMSAFSGRTAGAGAAQFSGEDAAKPTLPATAAPSAFPIAQAVPPLGASANDRSQAASTLSANPILTDPVLTNSSSGYDTGPEIHGDLPTASSEVGGVFASYAPSTPVYQYDDGQTPSAGIAPVGAVLGSAPAYTHAASGFPDSTQGTAGATDPFTAASLSSGALSTAPPFPPVSEGTVFAPKTRLNPNLHTRAVLPTGSFEAYEQKLRRFRLAHGQSISQADAAYREDAQQFHLSRSRGGRRSSLTQSTPSTAGFRLEQKTQASVR